MAGAGKESRRRLISNGVVLPMTRLMLQGRAVSVGADATAAAQAAAWALSNVIREGGPEVNPK
jgi:hypothetical protein